METVLLYTKEGCGLCDEVKVDLAALQADFPHILTEIDIMEDTAVYEKYKHSIPVVEIGTVRLQAPISKADLEAALSR